MEASSIQIDDGSTILPARMLNEFTYCPRLAYLEWIQGEFADNVDTVKGSFHHRHVDKEPARNRKNVSESKEDTIHERSLYLTADTLGLTAKIDLVVGENNEVTPVDYKKGKRPHVKKGAWAPERVQLCAQGLILREQEYSCEKGFIYFVGSRERVTVDFDEELVSFTLQQAEKMRRLADRSVIPQPLKDSAKCVRCSLVGVCLPDEVYLLKYGKKAVKTRKLAPARNDALPLYVQQPGVKVHKAGDVLQIRERQEVLAEARLIEISQLALFGSIQVSTQVIRELCRRNIPICYFSKNGWFYGITHGIVHKNVELRRAQFRAASEPRRCLALAKRFVHGKITNQRTILRRNNSDVSQDVLRDLKYCIDHAKKARSLDELLGIEGDAAQIYFSAFSGMLKCEDDEKPEFVFKTRNRRPPRDPVNALLSFAYAMLTRDWTITLQTVGFDPYMGFYHQPRYGKPALALDMMEEYRPLIAESAVITAINNCEIRKKDFLIRPGSVTLKPEARKRFLQTYERRMAQEITHPVFGYRVSYRRLLELQARLLSRYLFGEIPVYPVFITR